MQICTSWSLERVMLLKILRAIVTAPTRASMHWLDAALVMRFHNDLVLGRGAMGLARWPDRKEHKKIV